MAKITASDQWGTPGHVVDCVLKVFGEIDLDPCAESVHPSFSILAGANIPARTEAPAGAPMRGCWAAA